MQSRVWPTPNQKYVGLCACACVQELGHRLPGSQALLCWQHGHVLHEKIAWLCPLLCVWVHFIILLHLIHLHEYSKSRFTDIRRAAIYPAINKDTSFSLIWTVHSKKHESSATLWAHKFWLNSIKTYNTKNTVPPPYMSQWEDHYGLTTPNSFETSPNDAFDSFSNLACWDNKLSTGISTGLVIF